MKVLLVGGGRILYYLARQFIRKEYEVQIVTPAQEEARDLSQRLDRPVLAGDAKDQGGLENAGAFRADVVLASWPSNSPE